VLLEEAYVGADTQPAADPPVQQVATERDRVKVRVEANPPPSGSKPRRIRCYVHNRGTKRHKLIIQAREKLAQNDSASFQQNMNVASLRDALAGLGAIRKAVPLD
jgi:hypothetical protein